MAKYLDITISPDQNVFCPFTGELILSLHEEDFVLRGACFMIYVSETGMECLHKKYQARWDYFLNDPDESRWGEELQVFMESFEDDDNVIFIETRDYDGAYGLTFWIGLDLSLVGSQGRELRREAEGV